MSTSLIQNPILAGFNPDPSIVRVADDYYVATSTFEWYPGVQIHHSKDLVNWRLVSRPLNRSSLLDMRGNPDSCGVWAPCLSYDKGMFYLIYTDVKRFDGNYKDTHNYLTSCETIDGRWSDPVYMNSSGFDPSLFHDQNGKKWFVNMVWDYRHNKHPFAGVVLQEYCTVSKKLIGKAKNIFSGSKLALTEAPHLYQRNGYYYLVTAEGGTGYNHAMTLARSKNIDGPYELDPDGFILTAKDNQDLPLQRAGHGDLFDTPDGETYLVHLCGRPLSGPRRSPLGRETAIQKTQWTKDGWLKVIGEAGDRLPSLNVIGPNLPAHPWPKDDIQHDFDSEVLPSAFQWLRTPEPSDIMSLTARKGWLRLIGKESIGSLFTQALVARRQQSFSYVAETCLDFSPENFQQVAGLVCYYNGHKFHYCYVSVDDNGQRFVDIMQCNAEQSLALNFPLREGHINGYETDARFTLPKQGKVFLRAEVNDDTLHFFFSIDGIEYTKLPVNLDYSIVSDEAGKGEGASFTGAFVGMACQDTSGMNVVADFDYFKYEEIQS
ncbi:glycoside hydrolase family 43 protein [Paraglaciecola sp. L3A3]|uniref:glycoside hydrolase family 43 protein n=1 Tax=Paraglaciecola sp. L3A3 TaxID=2686358 RepID=UPI00131DC471|nr:glycoside hydrolase family 43 protein [Paraglaciecola sp. L3A3]